MKTKILRLISGGHKLVLKASDGSCLIAKEFSRSDVVHDLALYGINKPGVATKDTLIMVYEIIRHSKFMNIFKALPGEWNQKWLTQNQVIDFCRTLAEWLKQDSGSTFFLIKIDENQPVDENKPEYNLAVIRVRNFSHGLSFHVYRLEDDILWDGDDHRHVISPKLKAVV
jgi:hypothetical protein